MGSTCLTNESSESRPQICTQHTSSYLTLQKLLSSSNYGHLDALSQCTAFWTHWRMIDTCLHQLLLLHLLAITLLLCLNGMCNDRWVTVKDECWTDLKQKDEGWLPFTAESWNGHIFWYGWNNIFEWNFTSTMEQGYHPCGTMDLYVCVAHKKICQGDDVFAGHRCLA